MAKKRIAKKVNIFLKKVELIYIRGLVKDQSKKTADLFV